VHQLDGQLRLAQPAETSRRDDLTERHGRVATTERCGDLEQLFAAAYEQRVRGQRHARAGRQRRAVGPDVRWHGGEERLRCGESGRRVRRRAQLDQRLVDGELELGRRRDLCRRQAGVEQPESEGVLPGPVLRRLVIRRQVRGVLADQED
jgi:hypothetical protein